MPCTGNSSCVSALSLFLTRFLGVPCHQFDWVTKKRVPGSSSVELFASIAAGSLSHQPTMWHDVARQHIYTKAWLRTPTVVAVARCASHLHLCTSLSPRQYHRRPWWLCSNLMEAIDSHSLHKMHLLRQAGLQNLAWASTTSPSLMEELAQHVTFITAVSFR